MHRVPYPMHKVPHLRTDPPFTWHFESGLSHSHAQANPDSIGIRSQLNPDYRILVRKWIISGFCSEIVQSRSQAPERARKVGGRKGRVWSVFSKLVEELRRSGYHRNVSQCRIKIESAQEKIHKAWTERGGVAPTNRRRKTFLTTSSTTRRLML